MYLNDANGNRVNCKSIQGTIEKWKDDSIDCDLVRVFCPFLQKSLVTLIQS